MTLSTTGKIVRNCTLFLLLFFLTARFCPTLTGGVRYQEISSDLDPNPDWDVPLLQDPQNLDIQNRLNQPFHFLARGGQNLVFLGEDRETVLKFFNHTRSFSSKNGYDLRVPWLGHLFLSFKLAYENLR